MGRLGRQKNEKNELVGERRRERNRCLITSRSPTRGIARSLAAAEKLVARAAATLESQPATVFVRFACGVAPTR